MNFQDVFRRLNGCNRLRRCFLINLSQNYIECLLHLCTLTIQSRPIMAARTIASRQLVRVTENVSRHIYIQHRMQFRLQLASANCAYESVSAPL